MTVKYLIFFIFILLIASIHVNAQELEDNVPVKIKDTTVFTDTLLLHGTSPVTSSIDHEKYLLQNPTGALFKSMVIPGWGQLGNRKYVKAAFFASFDVWMILKALDHKKKAADLRSQFESAIDVDIRNEYYNLYQQERTRRNKYTWYAVIISFFSMFDAYVDAHMSGHPREKALTFDIIPIEQSGGQLTISYSF